MSRFKIRKRLNKTRLKAFEKAGWVAGNSSALMEKVNQFLDISTITAGSTYSARTAAIDIANAIEDYTCSDYKCLTLDCVAGCTATSKFSRTLRNKCKEMENGLFGCKK